MVLTYQTSGYRSAVADAAVANWWNLMHKRWPGGIKQAMTTYLSTGAPGNPFSAFIEDFQDARGPFADLVDVGNSEQDLVSSVEQLLGSLSPTDFLAPFRNSVSAFWAPLNAQQKAVDFATDEVQKGQKALNDITNSVADLNAKKDDAAKRLASSLLQKADMLAKGLDKIRLPGHFYTPTKWGIPIGPPVFVLGKWQPNGAFDDLVRSITDLKNLVADLDKKITDLVVVQQPQATANLAIVTAKLATANDGLGLALNTVKKAAPLLDKAQNELAKAEAVVLNLIPGVPLQSEPPPPEPEQAPALFINAGVHLEPEWLELVQRDAEEFKKQTGLSMTILSGNRSPTEQAALMYDEMKLSGDPKAYISNYRDQVIAQKVLRAFNQNTHDRTLAIAKMAKEMDWPLNQGAQLSKRFLGSGFDVKTEGLSDDQKKKLLTILLNDRPNGWGSNDGIIVEVPRSLLTQAHRLVRNGPWDKTQVRVELSPRQDFRVVGGQLLLTQPDLVIMPKSFSVDYGDIGPLLGRKGSSSWTRTSPTTWKEVKSDGSVEMFQVIDMFQVIEFGEPDNSLISSGSSQSVRSLSEPDKVFVIPDIQADPQFGVLLKGIEGRTELNDINVVN
jgi:hypothetical protein